jgi:hypothetical protein
MKFNSSTKKKLEQIFAELGYTIRYGKGRFNSGHCIVKEEQVVVINKFFDTEGRARVLFELLMQLEDIDIELLTDSSRKFLKNISKEKRIDDPIGPVTQLNVDQ